MTSFLFLDNIKKIQESLSTVLNNFENIMEKMSKCSIFYNIFK